MIIELQSINALESLKNRFMQNLSDSKRIIYANIYANVSLHLVMHLVILPHHTSSLIMHFTYCLFPIYNTDSYLKYPIVWIFQNKKTR